jgi:UDP-N-acetylmuramate dehydrogenase
MPGEYLDRCIILSATIRLSADEPDSIASRMREVTEKRNSKQPVELPSAGSFFKRPEGAYAAALIEEAGLKGLRVGGASVSEKHSGFIVNDRGASASDVLALAELVQERVYAEKGIMLEIEPQVI